MAKLVCNFISYALKRTVDITVVLPSVTIPEAMQLPMPGKENPVPPTHEVKENIRCCTYCTVWETTTRSGQVILMWKCLQKRETWQL